MRVKFELHIGIHNCEQTTELDVDDNTTDKELDGMLFDWVHDIIDAGWSKQEG